MKICVAQSKSEKGDVQRNIHHHLQLIESAITQHADLIIFPELSITSYEPALAKTLVRKVSDPIFNPFQQVADENGISIGIGMPTKATQGIHISLLLFQPHTTRGSYAKQMLHADELPYFAPGDHQTFLHIKGKKIALGICYETLHYEHILNAAENKADIYLASVAKSAAGVDKAYAHFPTVAKEFDMPIMMANCVGYCDNFLSTGQSAVWNAQGQLLQQLDDVNEGLLMYDTDTDGVERHPTKNHVTSTTIGGEVPLFKA